jgi:hypothetical protein
MANGWLCRYKVEQPTGLNMMAFLPLRAMRLTALTGLACAGALAFASAHASDDGAASAAIAKLLSAPTSAEAPAPTEAPVPAGGEHLMVTPQAGETLDRLMRRVMPSQPFKDDFIRKAFFKLNPKLANTSPYRGLPTSMSLAVPSAHDLRQQMLEQYPAVGRALFEAPLHRAAAEDTPAPGVNKRRWVHFP